jgi:predicted enzyme related to lactoylglutathione lyase
MDKQINPVNWFEIPVTDLDRAKKFYEYIFGIELALNNMGNLKMAWFPFAEEKAGATGTLMKAESYVPSYSGTMVYFSVDDIESTLQRVEQKGGKIITAKMSIGEFGFVGHFEDSEGNRVALHSQQ